MTIHAHPSMRYDLVCDGAVRKYPDGREICCDTPKGDAEYKRRTVEMAERQEYRCCICKARMNFPTFEHTLGRGNGGAHRDDRIVDELGHEMNGAAHATCNSEKGSQRSNPVMKRKQLHFTRTNAISGEQSLLSDPTQRGLQ